MKKITKFKIILLIYLLYTFTMASLFSYFLKINMEKSTILIIYTPIFIFIIISVIYFGIIRTSYERINYEMYFIFLKKKKNTIKAIYSALIGVSFIFILFVSQIIIVVLNTGAYNISLNGKILAGILIGIHTITFYLFILFYLKNEYEIKK